MVADPSKCRERPLPCVSRVTKDGCVGTASTQVGAGSASGFFARGSRWNIPCLVTSTVQLLAPHRETREPGLESSSECNDTCRACLSESASRPARGTPHRLAPRTAPASKTKRETREIVTRHKMDELRTSWGGVFPPMHRAVIEDGEHKRKREDEHDPSIREGAEGEYGSPQDRALAQRRRRFSKSRAR